MAREEHAFLKLVGDVKNEYLGVLRWIAEVFVDKMLRLGEVKYMGRYRRKVDPEALMGVRPVDTRSKTTYYLDVFSLEDFPVIEVDFRGSFEEFAARKVSKRMARLVEKKR